MGAMIAFNILSKFYNVAEDINFARFLGDFKRDRKKL